MMHGVLRFVMRKSVAWLRRTEDLTEVIKTVIVDCTVTACTLNSMIIIRHTSIDVCQLSDSCKFCSVNVICHSVRRFTRSVAVSVCKNTFTRVRFPRETLAKFQLHKKELSSGIIVSHSIDVNTTWLSFVPQPSVSNCVTKFFQCQFLVFKISISLAPEQTPIIRAAGCTFLLPREEWRRVGDRFTGGLALIMSAGPLYRPLTGSCSSRSYTFPRAKKRSCLSAINEGLLAS